MVEFRDEIYFAWFAIWTIRFQWIQLWLWFKCATLVCFSPPLQRNKVKCAHIQNIDRSPYKTDFDRSILLSGENSKGSFQICRQTPQGSIFSKVYRKNIPSEYNNKIYRDQAQKGVKSITALVDFRCRNPAFQPYNYVGVHTQGVDARQGINQWVCTCALGYKLGAKRGVPELCPCLWT